MPESSGSSVPGGMKDVLPQASHQAEMLSRTGFPIIELSLVISIFSLFWFFKVIRYEPSLQRDKLVFL
jgi:hypothetical protein